MEGRALLPVEEQLKVITSGTMQIVPLDELKKKLEKGTPLNITFGEKPAKKAGLKKMGYKYELSFVC